MTIKLANTSSNIEASTSARHRRRAGALLVIAPLQFWVVEAISASAWRDPGYNYAHNFISDLGVREEDVVFQERLVTSPLSALMNASFVVLGLLTILGIALLAGALGRSRRRTALVATALLFGSGAILVAAFPENTVLLAHIVGAFLNIGGGNLLAMLLGSLGVTMAMPRAWSVGSIVLGIVGTLAMTGLVLVPAIFSGTTERFSAYPYMVALLVTGALLVWQTQRTAPASSVLAE